MKPFHSLMLALGATVLIAFPAAAQTSTTDTTDLAATPAANADGTTTSIVKDGRPITMQHFRAQDQRGVNVFETPKEKGVEYTGFKMDFGAAFASQVQDIQHSNTADPVVVNGVDANQLMTIGGGFNTSTANLYLHAQLANGIRVQMTSYLSSRHHNETWVKDGFLLVDESPIDLKPLNRLFKYVTVKAGHFEINYGDAHFRRSDNGNAMYNPFVGNYILDAFTTEIGGEVYLRSKDIIAMGSITGGEIKGTVLTPSQRTPSKIGKIGFDHKFAPNLRVRLTSSFYHSNGSASNTLYSGDRAGSRYYFVLENTAATETANKASGMLDPAFKNRVNAVQVNPFVKYGGLEVFGVIERANGKAAAELDDRTWHHYAVDTVYRFMPREQMYVGLRYNRADGQVAGIVTDTNPGAKRWQAAAGWYMTPMILAKLEYVNQQYFNWPSNNIKNGGKFHGMMLEGVVGF